MRIHNDGYGWRQTCIVLAFLSQMLLIWAPGFVSSPSAVPVLRGLVVFFSFCVFALHIVYTRIETTTRRNAVIALGVILGLIAAALILLAYSDFYPERFANTLFGGAVTWATFRHARDNR